MQHYSQEKDYHGGVDFKFLEAMGIKVVMYQPWQIGLFHEELTGKFVWYPRKGTLMFDHPDFTIVKIGETGDFIAGGLEEWRDKEATENVYNEIIKKVRAQN